MEIQAKRVALAALVISTAATVPLAAQSLNVGGGSANFGRTSLAPGFLPDPFSVSVVSGGALHVPSLNLGTACVGYATADPDYIVDISGTSSFLTIYVEGSGDTGLVVNDPSGTWHCDDDSHSGSNPMLSFDAASPGQYDIWVTSYSAGESISGTLYISELGAGGSEASEASGSLTIGGSNSNFGRTSLAPGFAPDPFRVSIVSGGSIHVAPLNLASGCVGYATSSPDYILDVTSAMAYLAIFNEGDGDTGLVVNDPNGTWHCDDDSHSGVNPSVTLLKAPAGQYDIWVTSYTSGESISGSLGFTERRTP